MQPTGAPVYPPPTTTEMPLTWGDVRDLLTLASADVLGQAATLFVILGEDAVAGEPHYLPVGGHGLLAENVFETPTGLCPSSSLTADEYRPDLPIILGVGQLVLTNVTVAAGPPPDLSPAAEPYEFSL